MGGGWHRGDKGSTEMCSARCAETLLSAFEVQEPHLQCLALKLHRPRRVLLGSGGQNDGQLGREKVHHLMGVVRSMHPINQSVMPMFLANPLTGPGAYALRLSGRTPVYCQLLQDLHRGHIHHIIRLKAGLSGLYSSCKPVPRASRLQ